MLSPSSPSQKNPSEEDSSGSDAGSEVSVEPETDRFGFILTNGSTAGSVGPPPELVRQRETKWINIILQWDRMLLKKTSKVKVQCQKGIPASLRAKCWPLLCAATERMKQNENLYESLDSQPALQSWVDVIERDLDRQFPFHEMFLSKDGHGQRGLFRVLKAYTQYQPEEGYCQAQGPVAAVLLMNMPAEEAFWCLVQISEQYLPGYYSPLLEGVLFDAGMLTWVLKRTCPAVHKHLQHHGVEPLMFATDWLMCLFTRHLPFNTLLRVWDLFFCYGVRVLLQVAVVLVRRVLGRAEQRKQCQGQMETLERLRGVREEVQEEDDAFIAEVCSVPLSARDLEKQTEKELNKWRKERPSSTFDPRGRCQGYRMAWARARHSEEERDRKQREKGNLSVPLSRSASTLSLSPSLLHKRLRKGGKANPGEWEGGGKVVRHLSMGAKEDWRNWNEFNFKKVQGVQEEEDAEEHKKQSESKLTEQTEEKERLEEPKKMDKVQNTPTEHMEATVTVKEQIEPVKIKITEREESQPKETEDDKASSEQTEETNEETEPSHGPAKDQTAENIPQPTEQGEELDSSGQSQVLEQQNDEGQDQDIEAKDTKEEADEQVSESEHSAAVEENQREIQKDADADTHADEEIHTSVDSSQEQMIEADMKPEESTESKHEQQTQMDTFTEVSETTAETSPSSETNSNTEAGNFTDPDLIEIETQDEVTTETDKSSQGDATEVKYHSTESLAETEFGKECHTQTETETEEKVEEDPSTQDESETEEEQIDSEHIDSKTETKTEAETLILFSPECIQQEDTGVVADTEDKAEIPVADDTVKESSEAFTHCSETECDTVTSEPTLEKKEAILTVHSEAQVDNGQTQEEETSTETQINVETPDSVAPPEEEETSKQAEEAVNLTTEPDGKTSLVEMNTSEEPAPEEPSGQATAGPSEEEENTENVQENTVGEDDVFVSTPDVTDSPQIDSDSHVKNTDGSPTEPNNSGLTQASGHRSNRSSGDFCVRKSSSSRGSRLARRLSEDLFTVPQKTSQSQPVTNLPEVKHTEPPSNPGAINPTETPPDESLNRHTVCCCRDLPIMVLLHVLFEHAAGYALFAVKEVEEIGMLLPQVEQSVLSIGKFNSMVSLAAFFPFKSAQAALENMNAISEGVVHADLKLFLETNLPRSGKKKAALGVSDAKIGAALQEEFSISIQTGGVVAEITRGVRLHFHSLVKGLTGQAASKAQLGLGHSYSRAKVKFNVNRADNMIIQSIALLDQLDKDINTFSMRVREWYGYHFPELIKIVSDNSMYCRLAQLIGNRKELSEESLESLEEVVMDNAKAQAILDASRSSMGMDISPIDLINIERFSNRVVSLAAYRLELQEYLRSKMSQVAPNLAALIGEVVGARLISHAGSLTNLAKYPASTVQILGAEKALFRALKTRGNTPKYGLIFHSTFIGRAAAKNKGRISRYLANKCTIASRIDCFSELPTSVFGDKLREQVEERLSFYETGDLPRKNVDVMKEAVKEATDVAAELKRKLEKKEKKRKKREKKLQEANGETNGEAEAENGEADTSTVVKKKKKKQAAEEMEVEAEETPAAENGAEDAPAKKKKKRKSEAEEAAATDNGAEETDTPAKKKKKQKTEAVEAEPAEEIPETPVSEKKKKKKKKESAD